MSTDGVGVAVSPEEIARYLVDAIGGCKNNHAGKPCQWCVRAIATALRAAEARGREEAAKIAEAEIGPLCICARRIASAIRSLNAPQSPKSDE
jgi:hypothetical protein